jgi:hypothetical protein
MYNRILKRPMFRRGGPSFQSQGTGITSPFDTPRRGLVQYPGGYSGERTLEEIQVDREEIFAPKPHENINDIIASFGTYSSPYKDDGTAMTTGEMGALQAEGIKKIRDEREEKRQLAALTGLEKEEESLVRKDEQEFELAKLLKEFEHQSGMQVYDRGTQLQIAQMAKDNTATGRRLTENDERLKEEIAAADSLPPPQNKYAADAAKAKHKKAKDRIIEGSNLEAAAFKIASEMVRNNPGGMKSIDDIMIDLIVLIKAIQKQKFRSGGRVGYQMGTPNTGAMPVQQASLTETIDTPTEDITATETVTEGQQASVEMPYQEFRAAIPAEVSDDIVQLIYYNQDAFADFAQISTQADVYAFNNKYGVSLVLPMDTETT